MVRTLPTPEAAHPRRIRSDGWTVPRQRQFLKMLALTGSVERACESCGMSPSSAYRLRLHPDGAAFRDAWASAMVACVTSLREIAFDRAINGVEEPVMKRGEQVGRRTVHSERLLMFLLRHYDSQRVGGTHSPGPRPQTLLVETCDGLHPADISDPEDTAPPVDALPTEFAETSDAFG